MHEGKLSTNGDTPLVRLHRLLVLARESIIAGGSSGAVLAALESLQNTILGGANFLVSQLGREVPKTIDDDDCVR